MSLSVADRSLSVRPRSQPSVDPNVEAGTDTMRAAFANFLGLDAAFLPMHRPRDVDRGDEPATAVDYKKLLHHALRAHAPDWFPTGGVRSGADLPRALSLAAAKAYGLREADTETPGAMLAAATPGAVLLSHSAVESGIEAWRLGFSAPSVGAGRSANLASSVATMAVCLTGAVGCLAIWVGVGGVYERRSTNRAFLHALSDALPAQPADDPETPSLSAGPVAPPGPLTAADPPVGSAVMRSAFAQLMGLEAASLPEDSMAPWRTDTVLGGRTAGRVDYQNLLRLALDADAPSWFSVPEAADGATVTRSLGLRAAAAKAQEKSWVDAERTRCRRQNGPIAVAVFCSTMMFLHDPFWGEPESRRTLAFSYLFLPATFGLGYVLWRSSEPLLAHTARYRFAAELARQMVGAEAGPPAVGPREPQRSRRP